MKGNLTKEVWFLILPVLKAAGYLAMSGRARSRWRKMKGCKTLNQLGAFYAMRHSEDPVGQGRGCLHG